MIRPLARRTTRAARWALAMTCCLGCGPDPPERQRLAPPAPAAARAALAAALDAWKAGRPPGPVASRSPAAVAVDSSRQADPPPRLKSFTILGEVGGDDRRLFAVRLALDSPPEERDARYLVIGQDPLWVFRQEDYELISHWEHAMSPEEAAGAPPAGTARDE
jgi:hypothetical protein